MSQHPRGVGSRCETWHTRSEYDGTLLSDWFLYIRAILRLKWCVWTSQRHRLAMPHILYTSQHFFLAKKDLLHRTFFSKESTVSIAQTHWRAIRDVMHSLNIWYNSILGNESGIMIEFYFWKIALYLMTNCVSRDLFRQSRDIGSRCVTWHTCSDIINLYFVEWDLSPRALLRWKESVSTSQRHRLAMRNVTYSL